MVNQEPGDEVDQIIVGMQSLVDNNRTNLHVNTVIENEFASVSGGVFQSVFDRPRDEMADNISFDIREKLQEANKSIHEVMFKLSRVIDKGSNVPLLENNSSQVFTVYYGIPTLCRVDV